MSTETPVQESAFPSQIPAPPPQLSPALPPPQQHRRRWPRILTVAGIIGGVLTLGVIAVLVFTFVSTSTSESGAVKATQAYYDAMKAQNYTQAFTYLYPNRTIQETGVEIHVTEPVFVALAQNIDKSDGKVLSYSITSSEVNPTDTADVADVTVSVTRSSGSYDVHLQLQQEGNDWKILSMDGL